MITCTACATENPEGARFCSNCGSPLIATVTIPEPSPAPETSITAPPAPVVEQAAPLQPTKDRSIALILEILPGLFGFLGIGWLYAGNTTAGILWLVGYLLWTFFALVASILSLGIGLLCWFPISIACIVISAVTLNNYTKERPETFQP